MCVCVCVCKFIEKEKLKHHIDTSIQTLEIQLGCLPILLIVFDMFLDLDWSPPVVNSVDWM